MKVIRPGVLLFSEGQLTVFGWHFDGEGGPYPTNAEISRCALDFIAQQMHLPPSTVAEGPVTLEAERITAAALAKAAAREPARRRWRFWRSP